MRNFFYRISSAAARFMYGRNGGDQLNAALLALYLVLCVLQTLFARFRPLSLLLQLLTLAAAVLVMYRMFSRNLPKRQAENMRFLNWWRPIQIRLNGMKQRRLDKDHKYFTCKNCKTICRVPAGKGKIEITCPKCGQKIMGKS
ncbi:MAG: hypothetical protein K2O18_04165 [Oscillospiraceae bacterium]|nr:hypothetical protein [Oscillospiraceae bacterium]